MTNDCTQPGIAHSTPAATGADAQGRDLGVYLGTAQERLEQARDLLQAGALALQADRSAATRAAASHLVDTAVSAVKAAIDPFDCRVGPAAHVEAEAGMFRALSLLLVLRRDLAQPEPTDGQGLCDEPAADALQVAAEVVGGLVRQMEECLTEVCPG